MLTQTEIVIIDGQDWLLAGMEDRVRCGRRVPVLMSFDITDGIPTLVAGSEGSRWDERGLWWTNVSLLPSVEHLLFRLWGNTTCGDGVAGGGLRGEN